MQNGDPDLESLEATEPTPIAQLQPDLTDLASRIVDGEVTITWPHSIVTKSIAFKLAEHDFLLRRNKGQARVEFYGAAGKAVSAAGIGGGDQIRLGLAGVQWISGRDAGTEPHTPVRPDTVDWFLRFSDKLRLRLRRVEASSDEYITVDGPGAAEEESLPDGPSNDISEIETPETPAPGALENLAIPATAPTATMIGKRRASTAFEADEFASPAFLKRARVSYGSLFEGGMDIFDDDNRKKLGKKKRSRFSMHANWIYSSRTPSPEPEPAAEKESESESEVERETQNHYADTPSKPPTADERMRQQPQAEPAPELEQISAPEVPAAASSPTPQNPFTPALPLREEEHAQQFGLSQVQPEVQPEALPAVVSEPNGMALGPNVGFGHGIPESNIMNDFLHENIDPSLMGAHDRPHGNTMIDHIVGELSGDHGLHFPPNPHLAHEPQPPSFPIIPDHEQHGTPPYNSSSGEPTDWLPMPSPSFYPPIPAPNSLNNPVEILDSSSPIQERHPDRTEVEEDVDGSIQSPLSEGNDDVSEKRDMSDSEQEALEEDRRDYEMDDDESEEGSDVPGEDYDLRNYDRTQDDDVVEPEVDNKSDSSDPDENIVDADADDEEDEEEEHEEDEEEEHEEDVEDEEVKREAKQETGQLRYEQADRYLATEAREPMPEYSSSNAGSDKEEGVEDAEGDDENEQRYDEEDHIERRYEEEEEVEEDVEQGEEYDEEEYDEEEYDEESEEEEALPPAPPSDPVFIDLLSDSEDEEDEEPPKEQEKEKTLENESVSVPIGTTEKERDQEPRTAPEEKQSLDEPKKQVEMDQDIFPEPAESDAASGQELDERDTEKQPFDTESEALEQPPPTLAQDDTVHPEEQLEGEHLKPEEPGSAELETSRTPVAKPDTKEPTEPAEEHIEAVESKVEVEQERPSELAQVDVKDFVQQPPLADGAQSEKEVKANEVLTEVNDEPSLVETNEKEARVEGDVSPKQQQSTSTRDSTNTTEEDTSSLPNVVASQPLLNLPSEHGGVVADQAESESQAEGVTEVSSAETKQNPPETTDVDAMEVDTHATNLPTATEKSSPTLNEPQVSTDSQPNQEADEEHEDMVMEETPDLSVNHKELPVAPIPTESTGHREPDALASPPQTQPSQSAKVTTEASEPDDVQMADAQDAKHELPTPHESQEIPETSIDMESVDDEAEYSFAAEQQIMTESQEYEENERVRDTITVKEVRPAQSVEMEDKAASKPERDILITVQSLRSWDRRKSLSSDTTGDRGQDPSIVLAKAHAGTPTTDPEPPCKEEKSSPATGRITRSKADANAGQTTAGMQASAIATTPVPSTPSRSTRLATSPEVAQSKSPTSTADVRKTTPSAADSAATTALDDEQLSTLKLRLQKDLRTNLPEFLSLKSLRSNLTRIHDVMAIVTTTPPQPFRPRHGPRDYMVELILTDPSSTPANVSVAHIFRPHQSSLPNVHAGDVILLRHFQVVSIRKRGFGLRTSETSAWAVFEKGDEEMLPQIKGPPVELTDAEIAYAEGLRKWWSLLDDKTKVKIEKATDKAVQAGKGEDR